MTKKKASGKRRVAVALAKFLRQANPALKGRVIRLIKNRDGGFTIKARKVKV